MSNVTRKLAGGVARLLLAYVLIFSQGAWAAQYAKPTDTAKSIEQSTETPSSASGAARAQAAEVRGEASGKTASGEKPAADGKHTGIKVHGHWTIDVKNPDGTLAKHAEIENSLTPNGAAILAALLSRTVSPGLWAINMVGSITGMCGGTNTTCVVNEPGIGNPSGLPFVFSTLTVTFGANTGTVTLSGSAVVSVAGSIQSLASIFFVCSNSTAPSAPCNGSATNAGVFPGNTLANQLYNVTSVSLTSAQQVQVSAGQTMQVTVVISFS